MHILMCKAGGGGGGAVAGSHLGKEMLEDKAADVDRPAGRRVVQAALQRLVVQHDRHLRPAATTAATLANDSSPVQRSKGSSVLSLATHFCNICHEDGV